MTLFTLNHIEGMVLYHVTDISSTNKGLERVFVHIRIVSLPEIKLWLLPLLIQITDTDTAAQAVVIEGCDAKDITAA